jgi:anti-sigma28 factor (negative regulator of flagellin synthesis)
MNATSGVFLATENALANPSDKDKDWISDEDDLGELYSPEYLEDCAAGEARAERLAELRRRVAQGAYRINPEEVAGALLRRGLTED